MARREPTVQRISAGGRTYRVAAWEAPTGTPPVLALHGFTGVGADFAPLAAHLDLPVWAPDLVGHGGSDAPREPAPYALPAQAAAVDALGGALAVERPVLLGYSFGGRLALRVLAEHGARYAAAVLIGATPGLRDRAARAARAADDARLADRIERGGAAAFLAEWARHPLLVSQQRIASEHRARMARERTRHTARGLAHALREGGTGRMQPLWDRLPGVSCPVLLITGAEDAKFTALAASMQEALPRAEHVVVPEAGHCAHLERPAAAAAAIADFLRRALGG